MYASLVHLQYKAAESPFVKLELIQFITLKGVYCSQSLEKYKYCEYCKNPSRINLRFQTHSCEYTVARWNGCMMVLRRIHFNKRCFRKGFLRIIFRFHIYEPGLLNRERTCHGGCKGFISFFRARKNVKCNFGWENKDVIPQDNGSFTLYYSWPSNHRKIFLKPPS